MKALILAAGKSTRIAQISQGLPKPLLDVGGLTVIEHNIRLLARHGISKIWINLHFQPDLIRRKIGDGRKWGVEISYSHEKELLGTAGAARNLAAEFKHGTFLVLYGDNFTNCDVTALVREHDESKVIATIAVFDDRKNLHSGIAGGKVRLDRKGTITGFVEGKNNHTEASNFVNAGIYALDPEVLPFIPEKPSDFGRDVFPILLSEKRRLHAFKMEGYCLGLDTPEAYFKAQSLLSRT